MAHDRFDKTLWCILLVSLVTLAVVLTLNASTSGGSQHGSKELNKAMDREMAYRARVELINKLYGPVENLRTNGHKPEALLKLDELIRTYPGEAHGYMLKGQILREMGAEDEAVSSYVEGVKLNGDYVDDKSPLSRRSEIQRFVDEETKRIGARYAAEPGNRSIAVLLQKNNYLKSRLAGGCE